MPPDPDADADADHDGGAPRDPAPPAAVPQYIQEGLPKQDADTLREIRAYIDARLEYLETPPSEDEVEDVERRLEKVDEDDLSEDAQEEYEEIDAPAVSMYLEKRSCGKDCSGCPHGPYIYAYWRDGDKVRAKYLGKP